jgi:hypothetical protein
MIYMLSGGEETERYANQIADALRAAHWTVGANPGTHSGPARYGLTVAVNDVKHPHAATILLQSLGDAKFPSVEAEGDPSLSIDAIRVVVRAKPPSNKN